MDQIAVLHKTAKDFCVIRFEIFPFKVMDVEVYIEYKASTVESHH